MKDVRNRVTTVLEAHPSVRSVELVGSRARGYSTPLSDWDFELEVDDVDVLVRELPDLIETLGPLGHGWDPFGRRLNYMVMLPGPHKVDIIIEVPQEEAGPWTLSAETLPRIEHHFWDWSLWLGSKTLRGNHDLVTSELSKMTERLLQPLGARGRVTTLRQAVDEFRKARNEAERQLGSTIDRETETEVVRALEENALI